ncbi:hypothetical protein [Mesorhizobium sp. B1-1-4]|uniref:hypothetical protein n=1 Tax=Mesorhizobium sp. B1-1-4 TaxID=2589980 RepID=UPI001FED2CBE|nr:hypothetical protein [Mesorhizobium sp. B1-1-4]
MRVRVDETRHDNHSRSIDARHLLICGGGRAVAGGDDPAILHQDMTPRENPAPRIHGDDDTVFYQQGLGHSESLFGTVT